MYDILCTYPLKSDLFALVAHPTRPLIAFGLASGHVQVSEIPPEGDPKPAERVANTITTRWRTRRHKGSCRVLCISKDGEHLCGAGTDGIVKIASFETGIVRSKIAIPRVDSNPDPATALCMLNSHTLLLGTDSGALHVFDIQLDSSKIESKPAKTYYPHDDYVTSICALPPSTTSSATVAHQWLTTGGTTIAITDFRKGILAQSEDQMEELFSSAVVAGDKVMVGGANGVIRIWENGTWDDNEATVKVDPLAKASADVLASVPEQDLAVVGMDNGFIAFVEVIGKNGRWKSDQSVQHDEIDGVISIQFLRDHGKRMVSGGGSVIRIWERRGDSIAGRVANEFHENTPLSKALLGLDEIQAERVRADADKAAAEAAEAAEEEDPEAPPRKKRKKKNGAKIQGKGALPAFQFNGLD